MIAEAISGFVRQAATTISPTHPRDPALARMFGFGKNTSSGVSVDEDKVLALPAVWRAVNIISNSMMKLPFYVYREREEGREYDRNHPSWKCVRRKAHPEIKAPDFRQTLTGWALTWGNGLAYIDRPNWPDGPVELIPLLPDRTLPIRFKGGGAEIATEETDGVLMYATTIAGQPKKFLAEDVIHIRGYGPNPYWGYDVAELLKETFGGALAASEFGHRFYGQGASPAGFVETPFALKGEKKERFVASLKNATSGLGKAHKIALLEEGAKFTPYSIDPDKAQFLEGKQFDIRLLAMAIGIKAHKLVDSANTSYASLEQANQEHKDDDLMPWVCRWRNEMSEKLLTEEQNENETHCVDVDDENLQWVPFSDRAKGVVELYNNGLVDKDEGRRKMNYGPSKTPRAKDFRKPANIDFEGDVMVTVTPDEPEPEQEPSDEQAFNEVANAYLAKISGRLNNQAISKARKGAKEFLAWLDSLSPEDGPAVLQDGIDGLFEVKHGALNEIVNKATTDEELLALVLKYCEE